MAINARAAARKEAEIAFLKAEDELLKELGKKRKREAAEISAAIKEKDLPGYDPDEPIFYSEEDREEENEYSDFGEEFLKELESEEEEYLSYADRRKQKKSDTVFDTYNTGEEWLMSEGEDDLAKGFINNVRSAIGSGVEDFAYWLNDNAPWYEPAETVLKNNTAGKIEEKAQKQFGNAKANGVNGKFVDTMDDLSKGLGYNVFGAKAGNYIQSGAESFDEYRTLRDSGYTKEEATLAMAKKAPMIILSAKADDYIGKNSKVDEVLYGKSGIINDYSDATKKFISKQEDAVHKQMNNLKTDVLNKKLPKSEVKNFEIRIDKRIREITNSGYSHEEMEKYFGDLRKTLSELYNQKTKFLPVKEYAHVMSETATHTPTAKWKNGDFSKPIKNDLYDVDNKGFSEFKITGKKPIY